MCNAMHAVNSISRPQIRFRYVFSPYIIVILTFLLIGLIPSAEAQIEWTPEAQISINDLYDDWEPKITVDHSNVVWAIWENYGPNTTEILYTRFEDGYWSIPQPVNLGGIDIDDLGAIAVGPDGLPWLLLVSVFNAPPYMYYTRWNNIDWEPITPLFPDSSLFREPIDVQLTVDYEGVAWAVWSMYVNEDYDSMLYYSRCVENQWSIPDLVFPNSGPGRVNSRDITSGRQGDVWLVWGRSGPGLYDHAVLTSYWTGDHWATPDTVPNAKYGDGIAIGSSGDMWMVTHGSNEIWASQRQQDSWLPLEQVSSNPDNRYSNAGPGIEVINGSPWIVWQRHYGFSEHGREILFSRKQEDSWLPEIHISTADGLDDEVPQFCVSINGIACVVWQGFDGTDYEILFSMNEVLDIIELDTPIKPYTDFTVFPNPSYGLVHFNFDERIKVPEKITVYDLQGRLVWSWDASREYSYHFIHGFRLSWNCRYSSGIRVPSGIYIFKAEGERRRYSGRFVIIE